MALSLGCLATMVACGSGGDADGSAAVVSTTLGPGPTGDVLATTSSVAVGTTSPPGTGGQGEAGSSTTTHAGPGEPETTVGEQPSTDPADPGTPAIGATAPGTYRYAVDGTQEAIGILNRPFTDQATLAVDPPADGRQRTVLQDSDDRTESVMESRPEGIFLQVLAVQNAVLSARFEPSDALLAPTTVTPGQRWSWTATSTNGRTTLAASFVAVEIGMRTVAGTAVDAVTIDADFRFGGAADLASHRRLVVRASDPLFLEITEHATGTTQGVPFTQDQHTVLQSLTPS